MNILVLGVTGMLGSSVFRYLSADANKNVYGTIRGVSGKGYFTEEQGKKLFENIDVLRLDDLVAVISKVKPDVVVNCVGLIKQIEGASNPLNVLPINAMLPHRLERLCALSGARLVHVSTDCVYSGKRGLYRESDSSDAEDLYGKSKFIGELHDVPHAITLRTSIIGHELNGNNSLIEWFLSQSNAVKGYKNAIFSGLPTIELARIISDYVIERPGLSGLYHVSADPIDKFSLLKMVSEVYGKDIHIEPDTDFCIDRSLDSSRFREVFGYKPPCWRELVQRMHESYKVDK